MIKWPVLAYLLIVLPIRTTSFSHTNRQEDRKLASSPPPRDSSGHGQTTPHKEKEPRKPSSTRDQNLWTRIAMEESRPEALLKQPPGRSKRGLGNDGACGGTFTSPNGILTSPSYPNDYPNDADCTYSVSQLMGSYINISITNMDIEYSTDSYEYYGNYDYHQFDGNTCFDFLEIRNGSSQDSALLGKYCGDSYAISLPITIQTSGLNFWLRFYSDSSITWGGFRLEYSTWGKSTCNQESPCALGGGDCDNDGDCEGSLVCGNGNCASGSSNLDCCTMTCTDDSDCLNQECRTDANQCHLDSYSTYWSLCTHDAPCLEGDGDCDDNLDCNGSLVCGTNNCESGPSGMDCCATSCELENDCTSGFVCNGKSFCRVRSNNSDNGYCAQGGIICMEGEGGCSNDTECEVALVCGINNCAMGSPDTNCCTKICNNDSDCFNQECNNDLNQCRLDSYSTDWSNCSQDSPCHKGVGDCDHHTDCKGTLLCGIDNCASGPTGMDCCTDCSHLTDDDIFEAAVFRNDKKIYFILECNASDINSINSEGKTPLYLAAENDKEDVVRRLLLQPTIDVNKGCESGDMAGSSPLYAAALNNNLETVTMLIGHPDTDVNSNGYNPLIDASWYGFTEIVRELLEHPYIDVNIDSEFENPLRSAAEAGREEVVMLLLAHQDIDVNKGIEGGPWAGTTPLNQASWRNHLGTVNLLLSHPDIDVNKATISDGDNPLLTAVWYNFPEIVQVLLQHPLINVNQQRHTDWATPLFLAASRGRDSGINY